MIHFILPGSKIRPQQIGHGRHRLRPTPVHPDVVETERAGDPQNTQKYSRTAMFAGLFVAGCRASIRQLQVQDNTCEKALGSVAPSTCPTIAFAVKASNAEMGNKCPIDSSVKSDAQNTRIHASYHREKLLDICFLRTPFSTRGNETSENWADVSTLAVEIRSFREVVKKKKKKNTRARVNPR